jgi:hypothetical protein
MAARKLYTYATLLHGSDEIRLLQVGKRAHRRGFEYTLVHFSLETAPPFQAVSYAWGDPTRVFRSF